MFAFPLLTPIGQNSHGTAGGTHVDGAGQPAMTAAFMPFGNDYRGGVSIATGWVAGSLGGAERIVVSQLAGTGMVKVYSSGSALDGGPPVYLHSPSQHGDGADFREIAGFNPFGGAPGTQVAATSTPYGGNLLVSGVSPHDTAVRILKYELVRPDSHGAMLEAVPLGEVTAVRGSGPAILGGD